MKLEIIADTMAMNILTVKHPGRSRALSSVFNVKYKNKEAKLVHALKFWVLCLIPGVVILFMPLSKWSMLMRPAFGLVALLVELQFWLKINGDRLTECLIFWFNLLHP